MRHKAGDSMKRLEFNDYEDFACEVADTFDAICKNDDFEDVAMIAKYDEARKIIKELICLGYDINTIELKNPELGYDDVPYVISVCGIDSEHEVWCEPMIRDDGKYIDDESSVIYVLDNCSSEVLKHLDSDCIFEAGIVNVEDDSEEDCCECERCKADNNKTADSYKYFVNGKPVSKDAFDKYNESIFKAIRELEEFMKTSRWLMKL